jgi:hypothetical protein
MEVVGQKADGGQAAGGIRRGLQPTRNRKVGSGGDQPEKAKTSVKTEV